MAAWHVRSANLRWAGMEGGRTVPASGRRSNAATYGYSYLHAHTFADCDRHLYTVANPHTYFNALSDFNEVTNSNADAISDEHPIIFLRHRAERRWSSRARVLLARIETMQSRSAV